ncbi:MAG TPA: hypothetical protein VFE06_14165 [Acidobacteriaceae bacterium]|jgi:hypothetical protein|nr:hypothetical protein [Acidobacteriaceae bacterium]
MRRGISLTALLLAACGAATAQTSPAPAQAPAAQQQSAAVEPAATAASDAPAPAASLTPQQQRLLDEADQMVALAQQLRTEVDKTNQYTLSLKTLKRTDDIEKLAKTLQKQIERENH